MHEVYRGLTCIFPTLSIAEDVSGVSLRLESQVEHLKDGAFTEGQTATFTMVFARVKNETKWVHAFGYLLT